MLTRILKEDRSAERRHSPFEKPSPIPLRAGQSSTRTKAGSAAFPRLPSQSASTSQIYAAAAAFPFAPDGAHQRRARPPVHSSPATARGSSRMCSQQRSHFRPMGGIRGRPGRQSSASRSRRAAIPQMCAAMAFPFLSEETASKEGPPVRASRLRHAAIPKYTPRRQHSPCAPAGISRSKGDLSSPPRLRRLFGHHLTGFQLWPHYSRAALRCQGCGRGLQAREDRGARGGTPAGRPCQSHPTLL